MPAKNLRRINEDGIYLHIYNKGVEKRAIFNEEEDYKVFLSYLKDYLTPPKDPESTKKTFQVHGRTFRGSPHQPKNYYNQVELIAYALKPDHFHLILHQLTKGSVEKFIRSVGTRYSIYFNKKYHHSGMLFAGPYKSVFVPEANLPHLIRYLHRSNDYSSHAEYLGIRPTSWVNPQAVLAFFSHNLDQYKDFIDKDQPSSKGLLNGLTLDQELEHLAKSLPLIQEAEVLIKPRFRTWEFVTLSTLVFGILLSLGVRNVLASPGSDNYRLLSFINYRIKNPISYGSPSPPPQLIVATPVQSSPLPQPQVEGTSEAKLPTIVTIKIDDAISQVNIRQKPSATAKKVGVAKNGQTFELISTLSDWVEIKLASGSGYISAKYVDQK